MTPEAQRIAIAEAVRDYTICGDGLRDYSRCKHYLSDLNAMHEAEKVLTEEQHKEFRRQLKYICGTGATTEAELSEMLRARISSTAAQRAEAFLRTLNLWTS